MAMGGHFNPSLARQRQAKRHGEQQANLVVGGLQDTTLLMLPLRKPGKQEKPPAQASNHTAGNVP
jgi:hypothetical protein